MLFADLELTLQVTLSAQELPYPEEPVGAICVDNAILAHGGNRVDLLKVPELTCGQRKALADAIIQFIGEDEATQALESGRE